jgi:hypothetical protein
MPNPEPYICEECGAEFKPGDKAINVTGFAKAFCCTACAHMYLEDEESEFRAAFEIVVVKNKSPRPFGRGQGHKDNHHQKKVQITRS